MLKKVLPLLSLLAGLAGGGATAIVLMPDTSADHGEDNHAKASEAGSEHPAAPDPNSLEIVKLPNQFVVPVILNNRVRSMVILTVALEVDVAQADVVRTREPRLRDTFLDELFNLAAIGGFKDDVISRETLDIVRTALTKRAQESLGLDAVTVLVTDMARQDVR